MCLYLGFKGDIRGAGAANQWFYRTWSTEADAWDVGADGPRGDAPVLYCSFPSLKDPEHDPGPEQRHTGEVVTFAPWDAFAPWRDNFCRPVAGSIYGLEPTPDRFRNPWLRPRSPVPGLFFSGSDVASVGVIGAMMGGVLAAAAVDPVDTFRLMRALRG